MSSAADRAAGSGPVSGPGSPAPFPPASVASGPGGEGGPLIRRLSVIGLGYIGLPTAALFARCGLEVCGTDTDPAVVASVRAGRAHLMEPGLEPLVAQMVAAGRLRASGGVAPAEAYIIAVPTPFRDGFQPDLSCVQAAAAALAPVLVPGALVILESTVPVGATRALAGWLAALRPDLRFPPEAGAGADILIAHCPERVLPGQTLDEMVRNDRVIGGLDPRSGAAAAALYQRLTRGACLLTGAATAEMCKLAENASRDVQIAFANELAGLCQPVGVDVWELISLANRHPRVQILRPGPGVGGHCIAVDPWFLVAGAPEKAPLIRTARQVNDARPGIVLGEILAALEADRPAAADDWPAPSARGEKAGYAACAGTADGDPCGAGADFGAPAGRAEPAAQPGSGEYTAGVIGSAAADGPSGAVAGADADLPQLALLGLTFKPDIDDLRASPALEVAQRLAAMGRCRLLVVEPCLPDLPAPLAALGAKQVTLDAALESAGLICALVAHRAFAGLERRLRPGQRLLDFAGLRALSAAGQPGSGQSGVPDSHLPAGLITEALTTEAPITDCLSTDRLTETA